MQDQPDSSLELHSILNSFPDPPCTKNIEDNPVLANLSSFHRFCQDREPPKGKFISELKDLIFGKLSASDIRVCMETALDSLAEGALLSSRCLFYLMCVLVHMYTASPKEPEKIKRLATKAKKLFSKPPANSHQKKLPASISVQASYPDLRVSECLQCIT